MRGRNAVGRASRPSATEKEARARPEGSRTGVSPVRDGEGGACGGWTEKRQRSVTWERLPEGPFPRAEDRHSCLSGRHSCLSDGGR